MKSISIQYTYHLIHQYMYYPCTINKYCTVHNLTSCLHEENYIASELGCTPSPTRQHLHPLPSQGPAPLPSQALGQGAWTLACTLIKSRACTLTKLSLRARRLDPCLHPYQVKAQAPLPSQALGQGAWTPYQVKGLPSQLIKPYQGKVPAPLVKAPALVPNQACTCTKSSLLQGGTCSFACTLTKATGAGLSTKHLCCCILVLSWCCHCVHVCCHSIGTVMLS